jgi:polysaccharide export outer membrane protein
LQTLLSRLLTVSLLFVLTGCSELIPGINLHEGDRGTHQYQVVASNTDNGYKVVETAPVPEYTVIPVTPDVLRSLARQDQPGALVPLPSLLPSDVPPEYKLGPGDVFFVVVWDHPELTAPYTGLTNDLTNQGRLIAADGTTFYPYVGTFHAAGMTAAELRSYIAQHLNNVIKNPQVDVRVVAYRADRVEVTGEVQKPATINLDDTPKGVLQAIDLCGGLTLAASRRRALLVRGGVIHEIDLAGLLSGAKLVPNPALQPGDVLHIPDQSGDQVFVLGAVNKQAPVIIQQDSKSLIQALTEAGGLDILRGKESGILVFRPHRDPDMKVAANVFALDLSRPEGVLLASQFKLQPHDVVYVKQTAFAQYNSIISDLLPTVTTVFELNQLTK